MVVHRDIGVLTVKLGGRAEPVNETSRLFARTRGPVYIRRPNHPETCHLHPRKRHVSNTSHRRRRIHRLTYR